MCDSTHATSFTDTTTGFLPSSSTVCDGRREHVFPLFPHASSELPRRRQHVQIGHLLRLEQLELERLSLSERKTQFRLEHDRAALATRKHREAASRTNELQFRIKAILGRQVLAEHHQQHQQDDLLPPKPSFAALRGVSSIVELIHTDMSVAVGLIDKVFHSNSVVKTVGSTTLRDAMAQWLRQHYLSRYLSHYLPLASSIAVTSLIHFVEEQRKSQQQQIMRCWQQRHEECQRQQHIRRTQMLTAKEKLESSHKNALEMRKRVFLLYEWLNGKRALPHGTHIEPITRAEIQRRIKTDLAAGEYTLLLHLTTDNGRQLQKILT